MTTKSSRSRSKLMPISGLIAFVFWITARFLLKSDRFDESIRVLIAVSPVLPFAWFVWNFVQSAAQLDELQKKIQLEALAIAFPLMLVFLMTLSLIDVAIGVPHENFGVKHLWYYMPIFYFGSLSIASRRYR